MPYIVPNLFCGISKFGETTAKLMSFLAPNTTFNSLGTGHFGPKILGTHKIGTELNSADSCQISNGLIKGFGATGVQYLVFTIDFDRHSYNSVRRRR